MPAIGKYAVLASRCFMILPILYHQVQNDFLSVAVPCVLLSRREARSQCGCGHVAWLSQVLIWKQMWEGLGFPSHGVLPEKRHSWVCSHRKLSLPRAGGICVLGRDEHFWGEFCHPAARMQQGSLPVAPLGCLRAEAIGSPSSSLHVGASGEVCEGLWVLVFFQLEAL